MISKVKMPEVTLKKRDEMGIEEPVRKKKRVRWA